MARARSSGWRQRLDVALRATAAIVGGYAVTALATALAARHLPLARSEAVTAATLASFPVYAAILMAAFAAPRTATACAWLGGTCAVLGAALWLSLRLGGVA